MSEVTPERLRMIEGFALAVERDRRLLERDIAAAVKAGHSIRAVARAAHTSPRTVQRIAERES